MREEAVIELLEITKTMDNIDPNADLKTLAAIISRIRKLDTLYKEELTEVEKELLHSNSKLISLKICKILNFPTPEF